MGGKTKIVLDKSARSSESVLADCVNMVMAEEMRNVRAVRAVRAASAFKMQSDASFSGVKAALLIFGRKR
ncbi:hypothetical protein SAMN05445504_7776 [Burkholderia sp. CF099]|nr:hypothetical protein SAMN05445504_7776 [Burkholderia sp. CF099]